MISFRKNSASYCRLMTAIDSSGCGLSIAGKGRSVPAILVMVRHRLNDGRRIAGGEGVLQRLVEFLVDLAPGFPWLFRHVSFSLLH